MSGWKLRICIPNKFPGEDSAVGQGPPFEDHLPEALGTPPLAEEPIPFLSFLHILLLLCQSSQHSHTTKCSSSAFTTSKLRLSYSLNLFSSKLFSPTVFSDWFYFLNERNSNIIIDSECEREGLPGGSVVKNLLASAGDTGSIPGSGRCPGEGNSNPPQYSCLGNPLDRGA